MARPSPASPATAPAPASTPAASPAQRDERGRPRGAESPNQTDEMRSGGALPPAQGDGEPPDNRTGLSRPAGGTPNVPRS